MSAFKETLAATWETNAHRRWVIALIIIICGFVACTVIYDQLIRSGVEYEIVEFNSGQSFYVSLPNPLQLFYFRYF